MRHAAHTFGLNHTHGKAAQAGDVFRPVSFADPAAVLVEVPVDDVVAFVFDAAVIRRVAKDEIGLAAVFEVQTDVVEQAGLVVFNGEVVVGVSIFDDVIGQFALCQQGIGGDVFVFDIDGIEQGPGGFDFVGAFDLLVVYGQVAYFFWV